MRQIYVKSGAEVQGAPAGAAKRKDGGASNAQAKKPRK